MSQEDANKDTKIDTQPGDLDKSWDIIPTIFMFGTLEKMECWNGPVVP